MDNKGESRWQWCLDYPYKFPVFLSLQLHLSVIVHIFNEELTSNISSFVNFVLTNSRNFLEMIIGQSELK